REGPMNFARVCPLLAPVTLILLPLSLLAAGADKGPPATAGSGAGWKKLFDGQSLAGWKAADFYRPGKVSVRDGAVVMDKGRLMTGITYTRGDFPKMDYEV